jgi:hypothetical protein
MRLVVKQNGRTVNEYQFEKGPIYIGRHVHSQVFLQDRKVSRQHAVIFSSHDGKWMVEDLDSANKTYLNDEPIHKSEIKTGDVLNITDFAIEINLEDGVEVESESSETIHMEDTLSLSHGPQVIARDMDSEQAPPIRFPAARADDFMQATEAISKADNTDKLLLTLLDTIQKQFDAYTVWCALRTQPTGPMTCHAGKKRDGKTIQLDELKLSEKITQAVERKKFMLFLFSRIPNQAKEGDLRSVVIVPIMAQAGCFGILYVDNAIGDDHYSLSDLDYLMMIGIHTSNILHNLQEPA